MAIKLLACIGSLTIVVLSFWLGQRVPFEDQWPLYEALRTTASIIFAVVGAWLAIIYPDRLKLSFRQPAGAKVSNGGNMARMFTPIVHSTAILCLVLLIGIIAPLLKRIDFLLAHIEVMRSLSYGTLTILTLWQLWTVVLSLVPADVVASKANHDERHKKTLEGLTQQTGYVPKEPD
ncbi:TPA: hypothetical protein NHK96_001021 [Pseudomonas aeruginosa]|nr:hypothetical protein D480_0202325 [Pseudomonas aeruginosa]MBX6190345.1 hypothetical protein [Pseudomonas aeruginosa]MBX6717019.1 hypothetical protein [Pseudomonas aeruginosa]MBX6872498.1 hypothetical protein [Pseudomonas aeruginosa]QKL12932.1 hypothetical protein GEV42_13085 [Pseudomonas aeruginosa]